jgi:hypothetical protein
MLYLLLRMKADNHFDARRHPEEVMNRELKVASLEMFEIW